LKKEGGLMKRNENRYYSKSLTYKAYIPYFFLAPAIILLLIFFFVPVFSALIMSFTDFDIYSLGNLSNVRLIGLKNYKVLLDDPIFWQALRNTVYFVFIGGPITIIVSLFTAIIVNSKVVWVRSVFRLGFFTPVITTMVAVAVVWRYIYQPQYGLLNYLFSLVGIAGRDWLGDPLWSMPAIILLAIWKNFGYNMIIFLAGLQLIPDHLYEAARIDGAGKWKQFTNITIPMLAPTTLFVSVVTLIGYFQFFAEPYIMTNGGPLNSTISIVLLMYREGFRFWRMGYAASVAFMLFIIILIMTIIQLRLQKEKV
jgi:multiple sugar transport system permease protein